MEHAQDFDLLFTLAGGLIAGLVFGLITRRIGLSPIVGYLIGGILLGPFTPGFVADAELAAEMAELGVILLMFGVGLQFHLEELLAVRRIAIPGALFQTAAATLLGLGAALAFGWTFTAGLIFGMALSVASTVVLVRVLSDRKLLHTQAGHLAVGWLVVEDLITVLALVMLPQLASPSQDASVMGLLKAAGITLVKIASLVAIAWLLGKTVIPRLFTYIAGTKSRELFMLAVLSIALALALGSAFVFDASMALGAFIAGIIIGRSEFGARAASEAIPFRDAFSVIFFVSIGMLLNPMELVQHWDKLLVALGIIVIAKPLVAFLVVVLMRGPLEKAVPVAFALAQIGEFSFILATLGVGMKALPPEAVNILVAASIVSITLAPLLMRTAPWLIRTLGRMPYFRRQNLRAKETDQAPVPPADQYTAIVVGYGPIGKTLIRIFSTNAVRARVIELNIDLVQQLKADKVDVVYGDAANEMILETAGLETAGVILLTSSHIANRAEIVTIARRLNPHIRIIVRADFAKEQKDLYKRGANLVFTAEQEIALSMGEHVLRVLGATPEYLDTMRDEIVESFDSESILKAKQGRLKSEH